MFCENEDLANYFFKHDYHDRGLLKWQGFYVDPQLRPSKLTDKGD